MILILTKILVFLIWCFYACMEGAREAYLFHRTEVDKKTGRWLHITWSMQRAMVLALVAAISWQAAIACPFVFVWFHDGYYYTSRNRLNANVYPKRWFAQSTTSTALLTKFETPIVRTILFIVGVSWFVVSFFV